MALTFRDGKGSALTHDELDSNFRHFTGSHDVTGTLTVSGSLIVTGSVSITGSISFSGLPTTVTAAAAQGTGSLYMSGSVVNRSKALYIFTG